MNRPAILLAAVWIAALSLIAGVPAPAQTRTDVAVDNQADVPLPFPAADNQTAAPPSDNQAVAPFSDNQVVAPPSDNQVAAPPAGPGKKEAPPAGRTRAGGPSKPPVYISMDFTDVDLPVLIKFISEQTKKNFIFDERVQGKITVISPRKITVDEAYEVFLSVLQVKGFTTIEMPNAIKIVPLREAKQESLTTTAETLPASPTEFITRLIPLQFADVAEVTPVLAPLISKDGLITSFPASNTLLIIDTSANIDRILKILIDLDAAGAAATLRIFPLANAAATEVAKTLDTLYQEAAPAAPGAARARTGRPGKARGPAPRFIPDARTNSIIVLAMKEVIGDVEELIRKLDIPTPVHTGKINVYYLEHSDAEEMAKVLSTLSEKRPGAPAALPAAPPGQPPGQPPGAAARSIITAELEGGVRITADKATNSLIIIASLDDYQTLVDVIKKLDIRRRQVYVEALIMEITLDKGRDLGVELRGAFETNDGAVLGGTNFNFLGNVNELFQALALGNPLLFSGTGLIAGGIAGSVTLPDGTEIPAITAILRAVQNRDNINILSSPHLLTMDNKEAEIVVGENVPFITSSARDITAPNAPVVNTIERRDVGITLRLTPHIHESEFVSLEIFQESSAVKGGQSPLTVNQLGPTTTKRSAKTSVLVHNGDTVVLGGMMQETIENFRSQVPFLGSIPLLGHLFRFDSTSRRKTNLLIFLTPHVIKETADTSRITDKQKQRMDDFIERNKEEVERIAPPEAAEPAPGEKK